MTVFPETIPALLDAQASRGARVPWLYFESESYALADVREQVDRFAVGLAERGVVKGDVVVTILGNRPETIFSWLATNRLGAIAMPLNPALTSHERAGIFALAQPRVVVQTDEEARALARAGSGAPIVVVDPSDPAIALATSGTTGAPKIVLQTHRTYTLTAEAYASWIGLVPADRVLLTLPLFHVNAQAYGVMGALGTGASLAIGPKFSASRFWENAKRLGATQVNLIGAMISILLSTPASSADRDHGVRLCYAALALPEERHRAFEERFGVTMTVGYGLSESTFGTVWPREGARRYGTMGRLRQHPRLGEINRARVVRDDGGDAADDEPGELWLQNPATMAGYLRAPQETGAALADGWLHTGDVVRRDANGFFTFVARKKEMLRRRGENVSAAEVENAIAQHPSVAEVAVVAAASPLGEDDIVAYVAPKAGATIDVEALRSFAAERLAPFKVPSTFHIRDALPRTATERIAKHLLR